MHGHSNAIETTNKGQKHGLLFVRIFLSLFHFVKDGNCALKRTNGTLRLSCRALTAVVLNLIAETKTKTLLALMSVKLFMQCTHVLLW